MTRLLLCIVGVAVAVQANCPRVAVGGIPLLLRDAPAASTRATSLATTAAHSGCSRSGGGTRT